jgi:hypothetical protein
MGSFPPRRRNREPFAITQLSPTNANAGTAFTLTVNGNNFASGAAVNFNGAAQATTHVSANQLTAAIPGTADTKIWHCPCYCDKPRYLRRTVRRRIIETQSCDLDESYASRSRQPAVPLPNRF